MVFYNLLVSFDSENIKSLGYGSLDYEWHLSIQCTSCQTVSENEIYFKGLDEEPIPDSRGKCNFLMKCKTCKNIMSIELIDQKKYEFDLQGESEKKTVNYPLANFECRGVEPLTWNCQGLRVQSDTGTTFDDVDLTDTWVDYDENLGANCLIDNFKCQFQRGKK